MNFLNVMFRTTDVLSEKNKISLSSYLVYLSFSTHLDTCSRPITRKGRELRVYKLRRDVKHFQTLQKKRLEILSQSFKALKLSLRYGPNIYSTASHTDPDNKNAKYLIYVYPNDYFKLLCYLEDNWHILTLHLCYVV